MKSKDWFTGRIVIVALIVSAVGLFAFAPFQAATPPPIGPPPLTLPVLAGIAGVVVSLAFRYIPRLNDWYQAQPSANKSYVMLGALALVSLGLFGLSCANYSAQLNLPQIACSQAGIMDLVKLFIDALIANQATYVITPAKAATVAPAPTASPVG